MKQEAQVVTAVRLSRDMWNVYRGEDYLGYVVRSASATHGTTHGWIAESSNGKRQRSLRPTAYQAAKDQWGPEAGDAVR